MEKTVLFQPYQEVPSADLNELQTYVRTSLDHVVGDLLFDEGRYAGLAVAKTSTLEIQVATGRLVKSGAVYRKEAITTHSVTNLLATAGSTRKVLVLASGQTSNTDVETRKFLIDAVSRATQPKPVATRTSREVVISLVAGASAVSPVRPPVPAGSIVLAELTVSSAGIVNGPTMESGNAVLTLEAAVNAIEGLLATDRKTAAILATIRTDLAALQVELSRKAEADGLAHVRGDILNIREALGISDAGSFYGYDAFGDADESDATYGGYSARVDGGCMRHGDAERNSKLASLLNPADPKVDIAASGFILPASTPVLRLEQADYDGDVAIAQYPVSTVTSKKKTLSRMYIAYGALMGAAAFEALVRKNPKLTVLNPTTDAYETLDLTGKSWTVQGVAKVGTNRAAFSIVVSTAYWDIDEVEVTTTGSRVAQTFLCSQSGWYRRIELGLTELSAAGSMGVYICGTFLDGSPDVGTVYASVTLPVGSLKAWPTWTAFEFDPVFLKRGSRYCIVILTTGAHKIGTSLSNGASYGTMFVSTDGAYWSGEVAKDILFRLYGCKFSSSRVVVDISDITLAGGIKEIQTVLTGHQPEGTDLQVLARIAGVWRALNETDETVLAGLPTQVPLQFVFSGTPDLMPGVDLSKSRVVATRPNLTSKHYSTVRALVAATTTTKVTVEQASADFDPAHNTWTVKLLHGSGPVASVTATSETTSRTPTGISVRRWVFSGLPAINAWRIETTLTADHSTRAMSVTWRRDVAE